MHVWDKREYTLEIRSILSQLAKACDPLGIISPTMAEGKHISVQERKEKKRKEKKRREEKRREEKRREEKRREEKRREEKREERREKREERREKRKEKKRDGIPRFRQN